MQIATLHLFDAGGFPVHDSSSTRSQPSSLQAVSDQMDRLTQLQECMDKLTEIFFTATGVLQRDAPLISANPELPVTSWKPEQVEANWLANKDLAQTAAKDIVETAKVIDFLIDQLPGIAETEDEQIQTLQNLEEENLIAGKEMEEAIAEAERLRASIKTALRRIADDHADLHAKILTVIK
ncbi:hypothetical protein BASA81_014978 [Batrachochytrium salamandrivorans]|nr:hypothetical protein BASA81_014978 [Batrachochytrium salamandrivorans]